MEILDGDAVGLQAALDCIAADPHPDHLEEDRIVNGPARGIGAMLRRSVAASSAAAYGMQEGRAMVGGVILDGVLRHQLWFLTTHSAHSAPKWLLREGRRLLRLADGWLGWPHGFVQVIPESYRQGLHYARHMGFTEGGRFASAACPDQNLVIMQRMIPRWVQQPPRF